MSELSTENWMAIFFVFSFLMAGIGTFLFGRISVKHIEREMAKEGIEPPTWDKGIGGRVTMYAMVIVTNKVAKSSPVNDEAILRHTRNKDKQLALLYTISMLCSFIIMFTVVYLYGPKD
jgi:hypothetical protein